MLIEIGQSRSQRPPSFWLATGIATSGQVQLRKSAIHELPVTLRMLRVKSSQRHHLSSNITNNILLAFKFELTQKYSASKSRHY